MNRRNGGQVLVFIALAIFVLLGLAALAVDVGFMYSTRHELQRSADTGALAGASEFIEPGAAWSSNPEDPVMKLAESTARDFASKDTVVTSQLHRQDEIDVEFPSESRIQVTTHRTVPLFFARVLGRSSQLITATAVAEAAVAEKGVQCLKPWTIPLPWNDVDGDDKYDLNTDGEPIPLANLPIGYKMIIKIAEPFNQNGQIDLPSLQQEAGHFFALALCGDTGGDDYRNRIAAKCLDDCGVSIGDFVPLEPGGKVGPTKQAVNSIMSSDPGKWNESTNTVDGSSLGENWRESNRLVKIPIYDPRQMLANGRTEVEIAGFAGFWISDLDSNKGTVTGYYVPDTAVAAGGGAGVSSGPVLRYLHLVE